MACWVAGSSRLMPGMNLVMPWRSCGFPKSALRNGRKPEAGTVARRTRPAAHHGFSSHQNGASRIRRVRFHSAAHRQRRSRAHGVAHQQQRPVYPAAAAPAASATMAEVHSVCRRSAAWRYPRRSPGAGCLGSSSPGGSAPRPGRASRPGCRRSRAPAAPPAGRRQPERRVLRPAEQIQRGHGRVSHRAPRGREADQRRTGTPPWTTMPQPLPAAKGSCPPLATRQHKAAGT